MPIDTSKDITELNEEMVFLRRDLHRHPEIAFEEHRTAELIAKRLTALGYAVRTGVGQTGVIGVLDTGRPGPTVMLRADIDALPVLETPGRAHGSTTAGRMHACGHDAHTAIALTAAAVLARHKGQMRGKLKLCFQPAEEIVAGAQLMIDDGALKDPPVDYVLGLHVWSPLEVGNVGVRPGTMWASVDEVKLLVKGRGGHGGLPHLSVDPVAIAAQVVTALQTLVSREVSPMQSAVVGFGVVQGGTQFNVIPDTVELRGSIRALDKEVRREMLHRVREVAEGVAHAMRGDIVFDHLHGTPPTVNNAEVTAVVRRAAEATVGTRHVVDLDQAMAGDDMALFLERAPGCYFLVGCANAARGIGAPHHSPLFDVDEQALTIGANVLTRAALEYLGM